MTNEPTNAEIEELRRMVEPVMEAVQAWVDAREAVRHAGIIEHGKCARAEAAARGSMQAAAMRVAAQARVDALREIGGHEMLSGKWAGLINAHYVESMLAAAEAVVAALNGEQ